MARFVVSQGACPVCDRDVARVVHVTQGLQREVFQCPSHGNLAYGPGMIPLDKMGQHEVATITQLQHAQPMTGLELVH